MPRPLLSEALRGHGALLRDAAGERFVDELAPRDVVSRAMAARMAAQGTDHLWLDATGLERFPQRFPTIAASLTSIGLDPESDWLPIAPAAHHLSGGVLTDLWGATALPGLWAVGEVACTGVHGANRLASNSLLEGMVFGARLAERIASPHHDPEASGALRVVLGGVPLDGIGCTTLPDVPLRWEPDAAGGVRPRGRARCGQVAGLSATDDDRRRRRGAQRRVAGRGGGGRRRPGGRARQPARRRSRRESWATCCRWPTRCWSRPGPGPRAGVRTPAATSPRPTRSGAGARCTVTPRCGEPRPDRP